MSESIESWTENREHFEQQAREVCDLSILITKDNWFWTVVAWLVFLLSFGRMTRESFLEQFATTMGPIQAYPRKWKTISPLLITHESRHCQQFLNAGWFVPVLGWFFGRRVRIWVGFLPMSIAYGLFPLPLFLAWGRFRLELDAELHAWMAALEKDWRSPEEIVERARDKGELVASWSYLKSWPTKWAVRSFEQRALQLVESWKRDHPEPADEQASQDEMRAS